MIERLSGHDHGCSMGNPWMLDHMCAFHLTILAIPVIRGVAVACRLGEDAIFFTQTCRS